MQGHFELVAPLGVEVAALAWNGPARTRLCVIAKATFSMVAGEPARLADAVPLEASDLVPASTRLALHVEGTSQPGTSAASPARLALFRGGPLLSLDLATEPGRAFAARAPSPAAQAAAQALSARIECERRGGASRWADGPLALGVPEPNPTDLHAAAPPSAASGGLTGDEWLLLEHVVAGAPRLRTRLPGVRAHAELAGSRVALSLEGLTVHAQRSLVSLVWRGTWAAGAALGRITLELDGLHSSAPAGTVLLSAPAGSETVVLATPPEVRAAAVETALVDQSALLRHPRGARAALPFASVAERAAGLRVPVRSLTDLPHAPPKEMVPGDETLALGPPAVTPAHEARGPKVPRLVRHTSLELVTVPWQARPPTPSLTVVVKGTFELPLECDSDEPLRLCDRSEPPMGDLPANAMGPWAPTHASDLAIFKPRADVLLTGHAYATRPGQRRGLVTLSMGRGERAFERRVAVLGERRWEGSAPSEPQPFDRVPLTWQRAFGGPEHPANPVGVGHGDERLPSLEDPAAPLARRGDSPPPANVGPMGIAWPARRSLMGTYDGAWRAKRWPYFPDDFDWSFFQSAPRAQQLPWLSGDEPFALGGVHPSRPVIRGRLPGLRPRCFATLRDEGGAAAITAERVFEVILRLDTVHFEPDAGVAHLVWRGICELEREGDIEALYLAAEQAGEDAITKDGAVRALGGQPTEPVRVAPEPPLARLSAGAEPSAPVSTAEGPLTEAVPTLPAQRAAVVASPTLDQVDPLLELAARLAELGVATDAVEALRAAARESPRGEAAPPSEAAEATPAGAAPAAPAAATAPGANAEAPDFAYRALDGVELGGRSLRGARFTGASLKGAKLDGADLTGASFAGADLTGASLAGADLTGADFAKARIIDARLDGAKLGGADFTRVRGDRASVRRAAGEGALFVDALLDGACFDDAALRAADFTRATLTSTRASRAVLSRAKLMGAVATGASWAEAKLDDAVLDGARFDDAVLVRALAAGSRWDGAELGRASLAGASLVGASFADASLEAAQLSAADLSDARFDRARLARATLLRANAMGAVFEGADLCGADLRGSNLHGTAGYLSQSAGARLDGALVSASWFGQERDA
jgi:uncharacterized protein YjbI with pentapeptide repeats